MKIKTFKHYESEIIPVNSLATNAAGFQLKARWNDVNNGLDNRKLTARLTSRKIELVRQPSELLPNKITLLRLPQFVGKPPEQMPLQDFLNNKLYTVPHQSPQPDSRQAPHKGGLKARPY
ncbi:hypothetical protein ACO0LD_21300 [Undibacterium sp. Ji83W]|uniref:hypothetical protein n=1 Tax=Undibacterium sp. Ji83W TaxID=3413043 RepID=UPI003BF3C96C